MKRFNAYLVNLDPTLGSEIQRPLSLPHHFTRRNEPAHCDGHHCPMTTKNRPYPARVPCVFEGKEDQIMLAQIRAVDKAYLVKFLGRITADEQKQVLAVLAELFAV